MSGSGRYGPYVKHQKTNATIPKGEKPEEITLARAVELLAEREAKSPTKKKAAAKKTKSAKKGAKKTAAKKAPAKKAPAKKASRKAAAE